MTSEIRAFFEGYRAAFDTLDGEAVARLYSVPSGIATDRGYLHWADFAAIRENMIALCELYRESGYVSARFEPGAFLQQGRNFAVADVTWRIERSERRATLIFNTTYNLWRKEGLWRVLLATAYEEESPA